MADTRLSLSRLHSSFGGNIDRGQGGASRKGMIDRTLTSFTTRSVVLTTSPFSSWCSVNSISGMGTLWRLVMAAMAFACWVDGEAAIAKVERECQCRAN